jgi:mono/diheme cytochrome c family protein
VRRFALLFGLVILLVGVWYVWARDARGFSANAAPSWIESKLAAISRRLALPAGDNAARDPQPITAARLDRARQLFHDQCALCHAEDGSGHTTMGQSLYPKVPDLRGMTQNRTNGALFYSIRNGIRMSGMPAWSNQDSDSEIWALVALIRTQRERKQ